MSELLLRGWNVAVPVVDVGDDVFVIDDRDKTTYRLQVKTARAERQATPGEQVERWSAQFTLSRSQLGTPQANELFYMLVMRTEETWRFLVIPRAELFAIRERFMSPPPGTKRGPGRPPVADTQAKSDAINLEITLGNSAATVWGASLQAYLDCWPDDLSPVEGGPGAASRAASPH